jgi:hypothetical protein
MFFCWSFMFVLCNFRLLVLYGTSDKSASILAKITTFAYVVRGMYTQNMSIFVKATAAPKPKTKDVIKMTRVYAAVLIVFAFCQIITFEKFLTLFQSFGLPGGVPFSHFLATFIIITELFALPFLLRARLSPLARYVSMASGLLVAIMWLYVSLFVLSSVNAVTNIGFLGTVVSLLPGWWSVLISVAFGLLALWSLWGMWPSAKHKK